MEIDIFDMIFKIEDHEVSIIKNNISPWACVDCQVKLTHFYV